MGVRFPYAVSNTALFATTGSALEQACFTTPPVSQPLPGAQILLFWYINLSSAAGVTSTLIRVRRGSGITGAIVNSLTVADQTIVAPVVNLYRAGMYFDNPGEIGNLQYTLTITPTGNSGNVFLSDGALLSMVL